MDSSRKETLEALLPVPVHGASFVCETCLKGSGSDRLFKKSKNPAQSWLCQSCGRPVRMELYAEKVKIREELATIDPKFSEAP